MTLSRIAAFRLVTRAPERLLAFYAALGFTVGEALAVPPEECAMLGLSGTATRWPLRLGGTRIDLDHYTQPGRTYPKDADAASRCFQHLALVTDDVATSWAVAKAAGATPISCDGPVTLPRSSGGATAIKFRDPEGHPLELLRFADMADRDWVGSGIGGIDHSAIVAHDLDASIAFYTAHGLARAAGTLNRGSEQAALDGLADPVADVVPMMPGDARPHVELLHYRRPGEAPNGQVDVADVAATRIVWQGGDPALLRDPDGHFHQTGG